MFVITPVLMPATVLPFAAVIAGRRRGDRTCQATTTSRTTSPALPEHSAPHGVAFMAFTPLVVSLR